MPGNTNLVSLKTDIDSMILFDQEYDKEEARFIFFDNTGNGLRRVFNLSHLVDHGLTLSLLSLEDPINGFKACDEICLDHIEKCTWSTNGEEYSLKFKNNAVEYFEVIFTNRWQFMYVQNMISKSFNSNIIASESRK